MSTIEQISKLKVGTIEEKLNVLETLDGRSSEADLKLIFEALSDPKWIVRKKACDLLGACGPVILDQLAELLANGGEDQKFWTVKALVALGADSVPVLINALTRGGKTMRIYSATALGELKDPVAVPYLVQALGDRIWSVRRNAYGALVQFGDVAFDELRRAIESENEDTVFWSARALGKLGEKSRNVLLKALKDGNSQLKFILAAALGETGDDRIVKILIKNLREGSWIVQKRSADALVEIGERSLDPIEEAFQHAQPPQDYWLIDTLSRIPPRGIEILKQTFIEKGEAFRWERKDALAKIGESLLPLHEHLVCHESQEVRFFAISCLGELISSRRADDLLMRALSDASWSVRRLAADYLGDRGSMILDRLNLTLETGDEDLRYWVTYIFRKMGDLGLSYLIKALGDSNKNVAYFAASALGEVKRPEAVRPLIRALGDGDWSVRKNASESLVTLQEFAVPQLINSVNDEDEDIQYWVMRTLRNIGATAVPDTIKVLRKGSNEQRCFAARVLGELADPIAREPLAAALADGHEWVRQYAALALSKLDDDRAVDHFLAAFPDKTFHLHPAVHDVFKKFGSRCLPRVEEVLKSANPTALENALRVLGNIKDPSSFDVIRSFLEHKSEGVRISAVDALSHYPEHPEMIRSISPLLKSPSSKLRSRVYMALAESGSDEGTVEVLKAILASDDPRERRKLEDMLSKLGDRIIPILVGMFGASQVGIRKSAAEFLMNQIGERSRSAIEMAVKDEDKNVRFWANKVAKSLNERKVDS